MMALPIVKKKVVWRVGGPEGASSRPSSSMEGLGMSVSECPEAWRQIARLRGGDTWRLTPKAPRRSGVFLDVHAMSREQVAGLNMIAMSEGLLRFEKRWKAMWAIDDEDTGEIIAGVNDYWLKRGRGIGHVAVKVGNAFWDSRGQISREDLENWGNLDPEDTDYWDAPDDRGGFGDDEAETVSVVQFDSEEELFRYFPNCEVRRLNPGWWRAMHRYVSPRERPLTEFEAWVREVAYGIKRGVDGAITVAAEEMAKLVPEGSVIVPAPASKAGGYGGVAALADRVAELSRGISATLVSRETGVPSSHERRRAGGHGLAVEEHVASMRAAPGMEGRTIVLVDNVAMSGATLEAMRALLSERSPDVRAVVWAEGIA